MKKLITIAFVVLGLSSSVHADPITILITSGTLVGTGTEGARVTGGGSSPSGFSFAGQGSALESPWGAAVCSQPVCSPGYTIDLYSRFEGLGFPGLVTYGGVTYETGRRTGVPIASVDATWTGSMAIPIDFTGGTLTAPFAFSGLFVYQDVTGSGQVNLIGSGLASADLSRRGVNDSGEPLFGISNIVYTFGAEDVTPTPEPGTWFLLATGAALLARLRQRRSERWGCSPKPPHC